MEILDNISDGCCLFNSKMEIEFINKAGEMITNRPKEELLNQYLLDVMPNYRNTVLYELYQKAYREQTVQTVEIISEYSNKPLEVKIFPNKQGLLVIYSDITNRKENEKKEKYYDQLKIIGEMSAGVAHEVRNPMTTIKGFLQLMTQDESLHNYKGMFRLMIEEVNRVNELITNFLDLAKEKPSKIEYCNLNDIITTLYPLIETRAIKEGKYIILELGLIPKLYVDQNEIRQLLLNLINNSLDAMDEGKSVYITTFIEHNHVVLSIKDEGAGIPPDIMDKISMPFVTSKEHGTGLGLPICFSIAKRNNAEINFTSSSKGTTFNIVF